MAKHELPKINADQRTQLGSRYAARLRDTGRLPAVIYGHQIEPVHISVDHREMTELLHRNTHVLEVAFDSKAEPCLVKSIQWDHLGVQILHLDLTRVSMTERVTTSVELRFFGEPVALKEEGAILTRPYNTLEVECQAINIPESIVVNVAELEMGKPITVADLEMPEGVTATLDAETVIASISIMAEEEEPAEEVVEGAEGEPEVITAKKEEGEEEGDAPADTGGKQE